VKRGTGEECDGGDEQADEEMQVPKLMRKVVRRYFCSIKNDDIRHEQT
jgi:hypothetical protein